VKSASPVAAALRLDRSLSRATTKRSGTVRETHRRFIPNIPTSFPMLDIAEHVFQISVFPRRAVNAFLKRTGFVGDRIR
jgi:hypothetical protein